jgi:hypothetical protein
LVEHSLGKGEVTSSILVIGSMGCECDSGEGAVAGSWLIVRWVVESAAGLCVGVLLISWMVEGNKFVYERPGQKFFFAAGVAIYLSFGLASRFCFILAGIIYWSIAVVLLINLAKKAKVLLKAGS